MKKKYIIGTGVITLILSIVVLRMLNSAVSTGLSDGKIDPFQNPADLPIQTLSGDMTREDKHLVFQTYKDFMVYPPDSRPLLPEYRDIINHQVIPMIFRRMRVIDQNDYRRQTESDYFCRLQPVVYYITEGMPVMATVECTKDQRNPSERDKRSRLRISEVSINGNTPSKQWQIPSSMITFNDEGKDGDSTADDRIYTVRYMPVRSDWGNMVLTAKLKIEDEASGAEYTMIETVFSSPVAPARFNGQFHEQLRDGSLIVEAEVDVSMEGWYNLYANLQGSDGEWISVSNFNGKLRSGRQLVPFLFFGKIFHDREAQAPYKLTGLRGERNNQVINRDIMSQGPEAVFKAMKTAKSVDPDRQLVPVFEGPYITRKYEVSEFSDKEFDSQAKRERLQQYVDAGYAD